MKRLLPVWLIIVSITMSYVQVIDAGTFTDDFSDGNLDGWHIFRFPVAPGFPDIVKIKNEHLVVDTTIGKMEHPGALFKQFYMELRLGDPETWDSYTLTFRTRFVEAQEEVPAAFSIFVRSSTGWFDEMASQQMLILPVLQHVQVCTTPPNAKGDPETGEIEGMVHRQTFNHRHLRRPIRLDRWLPIEIVAKKSSFEFHFDDNLVSQYEDETAVPGTVGFGVASGMIVYLDDVVITGPGIPNIGSPQSVNPEVNLVTTWGAIKNLSRK